MQKALALEVARELKMSPEKVYEICKSFHDGIGIVLSDPGDCKSGLLIHNFLCFNLKESKLDKVLHLEDENTELRHRMKENLIKFRRKNKNNVKKKQAEG